MAAATEQQASEPASAAGGPTEMLGTALAVVALALAVLAHIH